MNKSTIITLAALAVVALFPPADRVIPAQPPKFGGYVSAEPERRISEGFVFVADVGGPVKIRFGQWLVQLGVVAAIGAAVAFVGRKTQCA